MVSYILAITLGVFISGEDRKYVLVIEPEQDECMTPQVYKESTYIREIEDHKFVVVLSVKCSRGA